jgi:tetratricopeptide (TPR) repeat protein
MPPLLGDSDEVQLAGIQALVAILESSADRFGPYHPNTLSVVNELAIAFWRAGEIDRAIGLLDRALDHLTSSLGPQDPMRIDVLSTLGAIMLEQHRLEQAGMILREVLECRVRHAGANHPDSLAAKGDLASVLFELGQDEEACLLEGDALESARKHLGKTHAVTCVLAWNRALSYDRVRDSESARAVIVNELAWLLAEDPSGLEEGQNTIRTLLAERLNWNAASAC